MKKYLFIFACMAIGSIFFIGCSNTNNNTSSAVTASIPMETTLKETVLSKVDESTDWKPTAYKTVNNFNGITMSVEKETLSANGLTLIFKNNSDKVCMYGDKFVLEKKINGLWHEVPITIKGDYGFKDIGYQVTSGQEKEWKVDWKWLYGSLNTGEYRIVKDVSDFRKTGDYDNYFLTSEFTIIN
jgi:hypothetical protein